MIHIYDYDRIWLLNDINEMSGLELTQLKTIDIKC